jgi:hypothetical protein
VERPRTAEGDDRRELQGLVVVESEAGQGVGELLEHDTGLEASQRRTEAQLGTGAEREVLVGVRAPEVELVRTIEHVGIAVRRADADEDVGARGHLDAAQRRGRRRAATPVHDRRVVAQDLLDGTGDGLRVDDERGPASPVLEQPAQRVAEQVGGRLVPGEEEAEQDRRDLLLGERRAGLVPGVHEVGGEVRTPLPPPVLGQCLAVAPERRHARGDGDLFGVRGSAEHELQPVGGTLLDDGDVLRRHPEDLEHDEGRQLPRQRRHDLGAPLVEPLVDEAAHEIAHERLERGDAAGTERGLGDAPRAGVRRGVDVGQGRDRTEPARGQRLAGGRARRGDRRQRVRGGEHLVTSQDLLDVGVARHHPQPHLVGPEHRLPRDQAGEVRVRVRQRGRRERIEVDGGHLVTSLIGLGATHGGAADRSPTTPCTRPPILAWRTGDELVAMSAS